jgi:hypothetical protein
VRHGNSILNNMGNPLPSSSNINSRLSSMPHGNNHHSSINGTNNKLRHSPSQRRLSTFSMTHWT